ncbi:MAG: endonuclease III [Bacteroidales bacterium]
MTRKERYQKVLEWFGENVPDPQTELHYGSAYELAVAVILSAQCTDARVNQITPGFFRRFPDAVALAKAKPEEVYELIKSCSYPNNKAKNLVGMARTLVDKFGGEMPADIDRLQQLPGVGRKTANVLASVLFKKPAMAVDTHVFRVAARIGLTSGAKTPFASEKQLVKYIPEEMIHKAHHWLILHGRYVCKARKPDCDNCGISGYCKYYNTKFRQAGNIK